MLIAPQNYFAILKMLLWLEHWGMCHQPKMSEADSMFTELRQNWTIDPKIFTAEIAENL